MKRKTAITALSFTILAAIFIVAGFQAEGAYCIVLAGMAAIAGLEAA